MLTSLSISNFALIDKLAIEFSSGFLTITGETGAGKSILLGALGLVLGKRADLTSLKNKDEKCVVEAHFQISNYQLQPFFEAANLDYEEETIIRREILPSGKSRAFINDTPVNLQELQELSAFLIDIHSQHQTQELSEDAFQFQIIDSFAANQEAIQSYRELLAQYKQDKAALVALSDQLQTILKEQDYNRFLLEELQGLPLHTIDQVALELQVEQLNNIEFIKENLGKTIAISDDEQVGAVFQLTEMKLAMQKVSAFSTDYQALFERLTSALIEVKDIRDELVELEEKLVQDPEKLEILQRQLQLLFSLQKKHQVTTVSDLIEIKTSLEQQVDSADSLEFEIKALEAQLQKTINDLDILATTIQASRIKAIPELTKKWTAILGQLGMPNARFLLEIKATSTYFENGKDAIVFMFSANKGVDFGLLRKVASGGEMSRIMLATKAILAHYSKLPTIIFDEIDTGVSGEIAHKMGEIMSDMSQNMQVFAITHLPQIAAKGAHHFKVYKSVVGTTTVTELKLLSNEERVVEIAQMLSGTSISESALNHAKALLN